MKKLLPLTAAALLAACQMPLDSDSQVLGNAEAPKPENANRQSAFMRDWQPRRGKEQMLKHIDGSAYCFQSNHMRVDADGAPRAYHPRNTGLDHLANAGYPNGNWQDILVKDPANPSRPYVQTSGEGEGHFLSMTALFDPSRGATDPRRYVDASRVPYLVFPFDYFQAGGTGRLGDLGLAIHLGSGKSTPFVVADIGPRNADMGEVSMALASALSGKSVNPRNGAGSPVGTVLYIVFPYSSDKFPWPRSAVNLSAAVETLLQNTRGDVLRECQPG